VLLAEIMSGDQKDWFVGIHEHDSLLENLIEQELTEEEKKAAWEEYENEKKGLVKNGQCQDYYYDHYCCCDDDGGQDSLVGKALDSQVERYRVRSSPRPPQKALNMSD
jgi:hypothetical protein